MSSARAASLALGVALATWLAPVVRSEAAVIYKYQAKPRAASHASRNSAPTHSPAVAPTPTHSPPPAPAPARAPDGPPLNVTVGAEGGENIAGVPAAEGDQLVENGLSSPLCEGSDSDQLSSAAQSNCHTSGFVGAPAPTNDYELDVNIDVGALGLSDGGLLSVIQDVFIAPLWNALVWVAHGLVVMLEWCYTLELLGGSTMSRIASSLREAHAGFTAPWLASALAVASAFVFYNGLIRRRVAETLGQALATLAMMAAGLWMIANPLGTIGAVGRWADQASVGTLGVVTQGTPANAPRTLGDSMRALFAGAIEAPWCFLEFGNVRWCSDPALLDQNLRKAAASVVASEQQQLKCTPSSDGVSCVSSGTSSALTIEHSTELVREADTNGALFLAFPANHVERNSVKDRSSLLHVLCQTTNDTQCKGPTAAEAEFRSDSGTFPRAIGVVLIAGGVLGMVLLFGLIAVRLLIAALVSLLMLLLAPFVALAPAFGDSGRALFIGWATRLLGAVTSKLVHSFLLGALLTMQRILIALQPLGWWTDWLLISAFWWTVFLKRHQAMAFVHNGGRRPVVPERKSIAGRLGGALESYGVTRHPVRWSQARINARIAPAPPAPDEQLRKRPPAAVKKTSAGSLNKQADKQSKRKRGPGLDKGFVSMSRKPDSRPETLAKRAQLARVRDAREVALADDDPRRAVKLAVRAQRIEAELRSEPTDDARPVAVGAAQAPRRGHRAQTGRTRLEGAATRAAHSSYPLFARADQAKRVSAQGRTSSQRGRTSVSVASPSRVAPDSHSRVNAAAEVNRAGAPSAGRRAPGRDAHDRVDAHGWVDAHDRVDNEFDRTLEERKRANLNPQTGSPATGSSSAADPRTPNRRSRIMDDAREVAAGRKRQLGREPNR